MGASKVVLAGRESSIRGGSLNEFQHHKTNVNGGVELGGNLIILLLSTGEQIPFAWSLLFRHAVECIVIVMSELKFGFPLRLLWVWCRFAFHQVQLFMHTQHNMVVELTFCHQYYGG